MKSAVVGDRVKIKNGEYSGKIGVVKYAAKPVNFFDESTLTIKFGGGYAIVKGGDVELVGE